MRRCLPLPSLPAVAASTVLIGAALFCAPALAAVLVALETLQTDIKRGDDVLVRVTLTNTAARPELLLRWRTPLDRIDAPLFEVQRDGQPVRYLGRHVKRGAPGPADYLRLKPGASVSRTVELSRLYEMSITGAYTIRYHSPAEPPSLADQLTSNQVSVWINGRLPRGSKTAPAPLLAATPGLSFSKCSNAQQEQLATALDAGRAMTAEAHAYLRAGATYGPRYSGWFGALDAMRGARVSSNIAAIRDAFENRPVKVDCDCDEPYFAYVYPAQPYTVYVCKAFWAAAVTGTDSRGGTLLHELSHFDVVAATDDHVYGHAAAAELARSSPERAIENADSYEYFGENTPVQD